MHAHMQRETETGRDRQRQAETGRGRQRQAEAGKGAKVIGNVLSLYIPGRSRST